MYIFRRRKIRSTNKKNVNKDSLKIIHQNIQSLNSKSTELQEFIQRINANVDILILTEAWACNIETYTYLLEGYKDE